MAAPHVAVLGLKELRRDLTRLDRENVPKAMVEAGQRAAEPVANRIRYSLPKRSGALAGTVRAAKVRTGATIRVGLGRAPYAGPIEFGGYPRGRAYLAAGRYIFPTARSLSSTAWKIYEAEIQRAIDRNGWETNPR